ADRPISTCSPRRCPKHSPRRLSSLQDAVAVTIGAGKIRPALRCKLGMRDIAITVAVDGVEMLAQKVALSLGPGDEAIGIGIKRRMDASEVEQELALGHRPVAISVDRGEMLVSQGRILRPGARAKRGECADTGGGYDRKSHDCPPHEQVRRLPMKAPLAAPAEVAINWPVPAPTRVPAAPPITAPLMVPAAQPSSCF